MDKKDACQIFFRRGWLAALSQDVQKEIIDKSSLLKIETDRIVYHFGDEPGGMYGLAAGSLAVSLETSRRDPYIAHFLLAGDWVGAGSVVMDLPRAVTLSARQNSIILHLPLSAIREMLRKAPEFWRELARCINLNLISALQGYDDLLITDANSRVAAVLLRLSGYYQRAAEDNDPHTINLTQTELAQISRLSRNAVGSALNAFAEQDLISTGYGQVRVLDPEKLKTLVDNQSEH